MQLDPRPLGEAPPTDTAVVAGGDQKLTRHARFTIPARLENISSVAEALRAFIDRHMPEEACNAVELGVVEALTNIVTHGYAGIAHGVVDLSFEQSESAAIVEVVDSGEPIPEAALRNAGSGCFDFNPADIDLLPEGGMGLSIIKSLFDVVRYQSEGNINRLTLAKRFDTSAAGGISGE